MSLGHRGGGDSKPRGGGFGRAELRGFRSEALVWVGQTDPDRWIVNAPSTLQPATSVLRKISLPPFLLSRTLYQPFVALLRFQPSPVSGQYNFEIWINARGWPALFTTAPRQRQKMKMYQSVDGRQKGKSCRGTFYLFHSYFFLLLILVIEFIAFFLSSNFACGRSYIVFSRRYDY